MKRLLVPFLVLSLVSLPAVAAERLAVRLQHGGALSAAEAERVLSLAEQVGRELTGLEVTRVAEGLLSGRCGGQDACLRATAAEGGRPVLVAYPLSFDWSFLHWYFVAFAGPEGDPFGHSRALDVKTLAALRVGLPISRTSKSRLPRSLLSQRPHTHHALADAIEQADLFANLMDHA